MYVTCLSSATAILQFICPDRPGLVSQLSGWIANHAGNIHHADHHIDAGAGLFLSRIEWELEGFALTRKLLAPSVNNLVEGLGGKAHLYFSDADFFLGTIGIYLNGMPKFVQICSKSWWLEIIKGICIGSSSLL